MKPSLLLYPGALLYGLVTEGRNALYDSGILTAQSSGIPLICVGNLSTGGTGKTPHVEFLLQLLEGKRTAVLSRGYGRRTQGYLEAEPGMDAGQLGDECLQVKRKFPNVPVVVAEDRAAAIRRMEAEMPDLECILMDDGFQHRRVDPTLSILLTDYHRPFWRDHLLPAGHLREARRHYRRADVIMVTKCPPLTPAIRASLQDAVRPMKGQALLFSGLQYLAPRDAAGKELLLAGRHVIAFSGLASATAFEEYVTTHALTCEHLSFPDHHRYADHELQSIVGKAAMAGDRQPLLLTTEKDFVKVSSHPLLQDRPLYYLPVKVQMEADQQHQLLQRINACLNR